MRAPSTGEARKPLADRLVAEAVQLVADAGPGALSLREVQRRAGVSPAAAYRHFKDREALLLAVAQQCAGLLADHIATALQAAPAPDDSEATVRARLLVGCRAYVDFAAANPGLYRAVYLSGEQLEELSDPSERARGNIGEGGYNLLVTALEGVAHAAGARLGPWDPLAVWSCCHGLAMLRLDAALRGLPQEVYEAARDSVLATITSAVPSNERAREGSAQVAFPQPPTGLRGDQVEGVARAESAGPSLPGPGTVDVTVQRSTESPLA